MFLSSRHCGAKGCDPRRLEVVPRGCPAKAGFGKCPVQGWRLPVLAGYPYAKNYECDTHICLRVAIHTCAKRFFITAYPVVLPWSLSGTCALRKEYAPATRVIKKLGVYLFRRWSALSSGNSAEGGSLAFQVCLTFINLLLT